MQEIPADFTLKHKELFKEQMHLQGPTGRVHSVYCRIYAPHRHVRIKLKDGWPEFAEENRFTIHTQLLFTYTAEARFLVQVIAPGRVEENLSNPAAPNHQLHPGGLIMHLRQSNIRLQNFSRNITYST